ncbi:DUF4917 family protein [Olivibacter sp. SDN3]|uniref:DUF4917 family protein n=1 Tax=Olivibacter sp. SDN3 TaxID=2764720 RepID=UPI0016511A61|nr:DUF4917 family protein [Olivibacter sp. SDN3]QNL48133.1 DUF4917 family protein [Olivibacter sp. SDN3]
MYKKITFQEALEISSVCNKRHLLIGNGFSIACRKDIFRYDSLYQQADFQKINPEIKEVFDHLGTKDFELVIKHLNYAIHVLTIYDPKNLYLITSLKNDVDELKSILVNTIANSHPENPSEILEEEYQNCRNFLSNFNNCYTLNYDLLLYWTFMHFQETKELRSDDGFRTPDNGQANFVTWDIEKTDGQNLFYLHGALHLFDSGAELQKYTWINTGIRLVEQIRNALNTDLYPLFVSEGTSREKTDRIMHSNYLSRGLRSFSHIGGCLFIYGHSLADNDDHILKLIPNCSIKSLFISLYGDITSESNKEIITKAERLLAKRKKKGYIELHFFDAESARVWG